MASPADKYRSWKPRPPRPGFLGAARTFARLPVLRQRKEGTMRPTTAEDNVFDLNALLHPGHGIRASEGRCASSRAYYRREAGYTRVLGLRCLCDSVLPSHALTCGTEKARVDRRNTGSSVRPGRRSRTLPAESLIGCAQSNGLSRLERRSTMTSKSTRPAPPSTHSRKWRGSKSRPKNGASLQGPRVTAAEGAASRDRFTHQRVGKLAGSEGANVTCSPEGTVSRC